MPGPVSDSCDPEFSTGDNSRAVKSAMADVYDFITTNVFRGEGPRFILDVVNGEPGTLLTGALSERQWRIIRFALERAGESV